MFPTGPPTGNSRSAYVRHHWDDADALDRYAAKCDQVQRARRLHEEARALRAESQQVRRRGKEVRAASPKQIALRPQPST